MKKVLKVFAIVFFGSAIISGIFSGFSNSENNALNKNDMGIKQVEVESKKLKNEDMKENEGKNILTEKEIDMFALETLENIYKEEFKDISIKIETKEGVKCIIFDSKTFSEVLLNSYVVNGNNEEIKELFEESKDVYVKLLISIKELYDSNNYVYDNYVIFIKNSFSEDERYIASYDINGSVYVF